MTFVTTLTVSLIVVKCTSPTRRTALLHASALWSTTGHSRTHAPNDRHPCPSLASLGRSATSSRHRQRPTAPSVEPSHNNGGEYSLQDSDLQRQPDSWGTWKMVGEVRLKRRFTNTRRDRIQIGDCTDEQITRWRSTKTPGTKTHGACSWQTLVQRTDCALRTMCLPTRSTKSSLHPSRRQQPVCKIQELPDSVHSLPEREHSQSV